MRFFLASSIVLSWLYPIKPPPPSGNVIQGVSGLVSAVKRLDLNGFIEALGKIQRGMSGVTDVYHLVNTAYKDSISLAKSGKDVIDSLKESFRNKPVWYPVLRGADTLIQNGQLAMFKKLVCEAPCRQDPVLQWGICQRLGELQAALCGIQRIDEAQYHSSEISIVTTWNGAVMWMSNNGSYPSS